MFVPFARDVSGEYSSVNLLYLKNYENSKNLFIEIVVVAYLYYNKIWYNKNRDVNGFFKLFVLNYFYILSLVF